MRMSLSGSNCTWNIFGECAIGMLAEVKLSSKSVLDVHPVANLELACDRNHVMWATMHGVAQLCVTFHAGFNVRAGYIQSMHYAGAQMEL